MFHVEHQKALPAKLRGALPFTFQKYRCACRCGRLAKAKDNYFLLFLVPAKINEGPVPAKPPKVCVFFWQFCLCPREHICGRIKRISAGAFFAARFLLCIIFRGFYDSFSYQ